MGEGRGGLKGKRELDGKWSLELEHCLVGDGITGWVGGDHMIGGWTRREGEAPGGRREHWIGGTEH